MARFTADPYLPELTSFQHDTVAHVVDRFYGADPTRRFLVADDTGLGKTKVARGVIAHTIERLQDDPKVERIDIIYICSNADIAAQNLRRINITGNGELAFNSRLGLLTMHTGSFGDRPNGLIDKPINLVSFSPGTSFDLGHQWGRLDERAILFALVTQWADLDGWQTHAAKVVFRGTAKLASLESALRAIDINKVDPALASSFRSAVVDKGFDRTLRELLAAIGRRRSLPKSEVATARGLIGNLRRELAAVNVAALSPDLVILDEFQRFHHLLDAVQTPAGELAHRLFNHQNARVLLLSATPYKPFTYAEETVDDHRTSFLRTLRFLAGGDPSVSVGDVAERLAHYRDVATTGRPVRAIAQDIRHRLLRVMTRQERPAAVDGLMLSEQVTPCEVQQRDLIDFARLRALARFVDGDLAVDYWKSVPYFANFMDAYQLGAKVREALLDPVRQPKVHELLRQTTRLDVDAIRAGQPIDLGNGRLRELAKQTTGAGWWQLLWLPPSLPYLRPEGPYGEEFARGITKRLIFSAWAAAPTAIASLLSYEADRRLNAANDGRSGAARPLEYRADGSPAALTTLAMFWPSPGLAEAADPLRHSRWAPEGLVDIAALEEATDRNDIERQRQAVAERIGLDREEPWLLAFAWPSAAPEHLDDDDIVQALRGDIVGDDDEVDDADEYVGNSTALERLVQEAMAIAGGHADVARRSAETGVTLVRLALHAPGNIAWRALGRLVHGTDVSAAGHWKAAAILASGFRTLFNRPETVALLSHLLPDEDYRSAVLRYCAWGNLQALMDEYLHHLRHAEGITITDDASLETLATTAREAITLRPSRYIAHDPTDWQPIPFTSRFALRYGSRSGDEEAARQPEIRRAFNSPFWPFVLASTSVGQEGIDLHWWSHAVMHWNTPSNPVDFEQREGRVHRYCGHAVRRNLAHAHRADILRSSDGDPWQAAYRLARSSAGLGDFAPHWVFPGPHTIERHIVPYPLSQDIDRLERVKTSRMLYRLTFGQPRQEDMLELLRAQGVHEHENAVDDMRIDLSPPRR